MREVEYIIQSNNQITGDVYELSLIGDLEGIRAGGFVEISVAGRFLRRPFSVYDAGDTLKLLYKVVGSGTRDMTELNVGDKVNALTGLGNGFVTDGSDKPLLIGGGIGVAPLYLLAKNFNAKGIKPTAVLGFRNSGEAKIAEAFYPFADVTVCTDDGSLGVRGNAVQTVKSLNLDFDKYYACGPTVMLRALQSYSTMGQLSLEARFGCGYGACMGCSIKTTAGYKRVCKDGPVFAAEEVRFEG